MLKAKYHPLAKRFWNWYIHRIIHSDFQELKWEISGDLNIDPDRSILLLANHCSWWDGFWVYELNRLLLGKEFHVMMLEEQLSKRQFLRYAGAYSINRESPRSMLETLQYSAQLLQSPNNLVLMFPQGRIESMYRQAPTVQKGFWRILQKTATPPQVIGCISSIDYFSERKPSLKLALSNIDDLSSFEAVRQGFTQLYQNARQVQAQQFV